MRLRYHSLLSCFIFFALIATGGISHAANILNITGPSPFGFQNQTVLVEGWSQSGTYSNVSITMPLRDESTGSPIAGVEGTVYLMNQIGPGTTSAHEVAPPVSISGLTDTFVPYTLFSGLTLPPGNYYIVLSSTNTDPLSMSAEGTGNSTVTTGIGVNALGSEAPETPDAYPPASSLTLSQPGNLFITVTGDLVSTAAVSVPALDIAGLAMLMLCLAGAAIFTLHRRRA
ncbi:MAG: hypothetical protein P8Z71_09200 [Candidatus Sulfobium sp.]